MAEKSIETSPMPAATSGGDIPLGSLRDEMERMFQAFGMPQMALTAGLPDGTIGLRVDIAESDAEIQVKADLAGIPEQDVEVTLEGDVLRIRAERKRADEKKDRTWRVVERSHGMFERRIAVPRGIDPDAVEATFDKGVLTVTLPKPKAAASSARRIAVKASA